MKKIQELQKQINEKIVSTVLTDEQKTKYKELSGEPFKGEINMQLPFGRRGQ